MVIGVCSVRIIEKGTGLRCTVKGMGLHFQRDNLPMDHGIMDKGQGDLQRGGHKEGIGLTCMVLTKENIGLCR